MKPKHIAATTAAIYALFIAPPASAQGDANQSDVTLPEVKVQAAADDNSGFFAKKAGSTTKSDARLLETPQSITVLTRDLLDSQQTQTLPEALRNVAGVVSGNYGRRGWDDFIIRGQRANESIFLDGLSVSQSGRIAQEPFGMDRMEVLKGPASILFGKVQPGGMVNMVSKRPRHDAFNELGITLGSDRFKQTTFDLGRPISDNGKSAFRINGLILDRDDPTDFVYQKHRWLAPSLALDLGPNTDLTFLASYNYNEYLRQQGLSPIGTVLPNRNGTIPFNRFIGEPAFGPYQAEQYRLGYALEHRFATGWKLRQNFRWQEEEIEGRGIFHGTLRTDQRTQNRTGIKQAIDGQVLGLDTNIEKRIDAAGMTHTLLLGLDLNRDRERFGSTSCTIAAIDLYQPVYGAPVTCPARPNSDTTTTISSAGLYARDQIKFGERLNLVFGARRDHNRNEMLNNRSGAMQRQDDNAATMSAGVVYELVPGVAPYISYADSFLPVSGTTADGAQFKPETGTQAEVGVKLDAGRITSSLALYDLKRQNVLAADTDNPGFNVQTGEQRSKGFEAEIAMDLRSGWNLFGAYTYTDAKVTKDIAANVGKPLNNVPRHSASLWSTYRFHQGALRGWGFSAGLRHMGEMRGYSFNYAIPAYTVADAAVSYIGAGYRLSLNVKNLFDKKYYAGGLSNNVIALGDPRQVLLNVVFDF